MSDQAEPKLQTIIAKVDASITEFRREANSVKRYNRALADEMEALCREHIETFSNALKLAVTASTEAVASLASLGSRVDSDRARYLLQFLQDSIPRIRRKLFSPFWFGSQPNVLTDLDQTEKAIDTHNLREMALGERLVRLKSSFQKVEDIVSQLEQDRQVSKRRTPVKTLLWGIPIWLGILLSGRFGVLGNSITFFLLLIAAIVTFVLANRKALAAVRSKSHSGRNVKAWSSRFRAEFFLPVIGTVLFFVGTLFFGAFQSRSLAAAFFTRDPALISAATRFEAKPGDELYMPITISSSTEALYQVNVDIDSPILEIQNPLRAKVIGGSPVVLPLKVQVLKDVPTGTFPATLTISYTTASTSFLYSGFVPKTRHTAIEIQIKGR